MGAHRGGRGARRHDQGGRLRACPSSASRRPRPAARPASTAARRSIVGVNKYRLADEPELVDVLDIDNTNVREQQIARLERIRAERDDAARARPRSQALPRAPRRRRQPARALHRRGPGPGHRRRDERRHGVGVRPPPGGDPYASRGVYGAAYEGDEELRRASSRTSTRSPTEEGRRPRILMAKMGQDGHDRGAKVVAHGLRRPRLRRRLRPAVRDAGRGGARRRRERRPRGRGVEPGRRAQDARAPADRGAGQGRAPTTSSSSSAA